MRNRAYAISQYCIKTTCRISKTCKNLIYKIVILEPSSSMVILFFAYSYIYWKLYFHFTFFLAHANFIDSYVQFCAGNFERKFLYSSYRDSCYKENDTWENQLACSVQPESYKLKMEESNFYSWTRLQYYCSDVNIPFYFRSFFLVFYSILHILYVRLHCTFIKDRISGYRPAR